MVNSPSEPFSKRQKIRHDPTRPSPSHRMTGQPFELSIDGVRERNRRVRINPIVDSTRIKDINDYTPPMSSLETSLDYQIAASLQASEYEELGVSKGSPRRLPFKDHSDPENMGVVPDVHALFATYDATFFSGLLCKNGVCLSWSKRMTLCAGLCRYDIRSKACDIRLSEKLLQFRSPKEVRETLIHEMIHAEHFLKGISDNRDGHGPLFVDKMQTINRATGLNITVYHSFHDEVDYHRQHIWKCDGPCLREKPYFGICKRAMNRPPGPSDPWYNRHRVSCGGVFTKISEPPTKKISKSKKTSMTKKTSDGQSQAGNLHRYLDKPTSKVLPLTPCQDNMNIIPSSADLCDALEDSSGFQHNHKVSNTPHRSQDVTVSYNTTWGNGLKLGVEDRRRGNTSNFHGGCNTSDVRLRWDPDDGYTLVSESRHSPDRSM